MWAFVLTALAVVSGIAAIVFFVDRFRRRREVPRRGDIRAKIMASDPKSDWTKVVRGALETATLNSDVSVRLEMMRADEGVHCETFEDAWATGFPDASARSYWCSVYCGPSLIEQLVLVSVDGGRALLPVPQVGDDERAHDEVSPYDLKVAQIMDALGETEEYLQMANLYVAHHEGAA